MNGNFGPRPKRPHRQQLEKEAEIARLRAEGSERIGRLTEKEFLIAGVALYAGEGGKTGHEVTFPNSDPRMILFFLTWFRTFFEVDEGRLHLVLYLHEGLDLDAATSFWAALTGIPASQFNKPHRPVADPSIRLSKHPMGCPRVRYACSRSHRAVMGLVDALLTCSDAIPG